MVVVYPALQKLKRKLDVRLQVKDLGASRFKCMERIESSVSKIPPPIDPVKWAVCLMSSSSSDVVVESYDSTEQTSPAMYGVSLSICVYIVSAIYCSVGFHLLNQLHLEMTVPLDGTVIKINVLYLYGDVQPTVREYYP